MSITASTLYRDSYNFMRNQLGSVFALSVLAALITVILSWILSPSAEQVDAIGQLMSNITGMSVGDMMGYLEQQITPEQQSAIFRYSLAALFSTLAGNVILVGGVLTLVQLVSQGVRASVVQVMTASLPVLPRLIILLFICSIMFRFGLALLLVPAFLVAIAWAMSPVIACKENVGVFRALGMSTRLSFSNVRLVAPAMMLWIVAQVVLMLFVGVLSALNPMLGAVILGALSNMISAFMLIYMFRLYMKLQA
ncbi:YciC family protein [Rahnella victoriana]|uniref:YciC family protein n=1 Tax=Rahnella victoriana TaxID=1510570 RepID=UPI001E470495|nr:YciC family protein [Rahnella victoriana]UHM90567.1 envelope biogenesis factor ElyC [Rahnella victoriana]